MKSDGIHSMVNREDMTPGARKMRDFYERKPGAGIYQKEFGFFTLERWAYEGYLPQNVTQEELDRIFSFDPPGKHFLGGLGWCEAGFCPFFE